MINEEIPGEFTGGIPGGRSWKNLWSKYFLNEISLEKFMEEVMEL